MNFISTIPPILQKTNCDQNSNVGKVKEDNNLQHCPLAVSSLDNARHSTKLDIECLCL